MKIAGIRFPENWRVYDFDATDVPVSVGDDVIVESDRGQGFARVVRLREADALPQPQKQDQDLKDRNGQAGKKSNGQEQEEEIEIEVETPGSIAAAASPQPPAKGHRKVLRKATDDDLRKAEKNRDREKEAFRVCQDLIAERELVMKLIRAEYSFDGSRVTFYFFSENRVDFRDLVKDLAHKLRSRIEMRQVGVRDVARMIGGFGPCGRELCCTSFLRGFEPVSIRMAKKQEMVLNPAKISGICGRLLCCLSYEYQMYDEIKKDLAELRQTAAKEKQEEQERKLAEQRREADEQRQAEEQRRREDDRKRQQQKKQQQPKQRPSDQQQEGKKQEKKREGRPEQRQPQQQDQKQREKRQQNQQQKLDQKSGEQKPGPETPEQAGTVEQQAEKGGGKRKRRFWRKKKRKGAGGQEGGGTQGGGPQPPAGP